ncbi:helix-turn-helix transcriptional regulator [Anaerotruncus colihominis]|jgi:transcriptional regulator with XRE-family HTH domain|uniref:XRE family transcriptional regulator n=1 Tax=Anaerotruncus colihominis TaxID=169435 RepID=A0A845RRN5_9FIRM|nr:helix-turn-helix transcriptional regulator [Anaerotruncus colihominis]NBI80282.1 XRE family transcriptional regulator [Anaerotruncus colihominis]
MEKQTVDKALFGQRFSELLRISGETTYSIAAALSMSPGTISRYANGLMAPKIPTVQSLAARFGVDPQWLMGRNVPKYPKPDTSAAIDDGLAQYLEELKNRSELRMLFSVSKNATREDVMRAVAIIEALKKEEEGRS